MNPSPSEGGSPLAHPRSGETGNKTGRGSLFDPLFWTGAAWGGFNGAEGDRTPGLYSAIVALSQLSYSPIREGSILPRIGRGG